MGLLISYMGQVVSYVSQAALHVYRPYLLSSSEHHIYVRTGDKRGAGTDANVYVRLYDSDGRQSADITLDVPFRDDLERGNMDVFPCPKLAGFKDIAKIELWRDEKGIWDNWYVDYVMVQHVATKRSFYFPIHRWIRAYQHYVFKEFDSSLPQHDDEQKFRKQELLEKRQTYEFVCHYSGIPTQAKSLPADESFSNEYKWNLVARKVQMLAESAITRRLVKDWESLEDIKNMFKFKHFPLPECVNDWQTDEHFGRQRLTGLNAVAIRLCTEIPDNFAVTDDHVRPFLEGNTIEGAIGKKKLFYVDLKILEGVPTIPDKKVCAPLALFYVREDEAMVPVAIQLHQEKGPGNPVFVPSDPKYTWLLAKMWFNNADAQVHQSNTHLGLTHLIMEGVVVCTHRNLSPSHPMFKLLAPHFLYLIAINTRGLALLIS
ncbi:PREDICTED: arachidonate 5-lipoxygenase-like, partial [Priapulus caudatus]|uniref:Arachidonate 5-lipoxygenase-like n=1 Tax=Priapulus caudatus TaxID=37621 RepID=A0ABM1EEL8_PRICU